MKTSINLTEETLKNLEYIKKQNSWITNTAQAIRYAIAICKAFEEDKENE